MTLSGGELTRPRFGSERRMRAFVRKRKAGNGRPTLPGRYHRGINRARGANTLRLVVISVSAAEFVTMTTFVRSSSLADLGKSSLRFRVINIAGTISLFHFASTDNRFLIMLIVLSEYKTPMAAATW